MAGGLLPFEFLSPNLVDGLIQVDHEVAAVEHVQRLPGLPRDHFQVGGCHRSVQTKRSARACSGPSSRKKPSEFLAVRFVPIYSSRRQPWSIGQTNGR